MEETKATVVTPRSRGLLRRLSVVPVALALCVLALLYVFRWSYLEGPARGALTTTLENSIGNDVVLRVGEIRGPLFTGLSIAHIETIHPATSGFIRGVDLVDVRLNYRLIELIPLFAGALGIPVAGPDAEWLFAEEIHVPRLVAELHEIWPRGTTGQASGEVLVRSAAGWARPELAVALESAESGHSALLRVQLEGLNRGEAVPDALEVETLDASIVVAENRLEIDLDVNDGRVATARASLEASDRVTRESSDGPVDAVLTRGLVSARAPGVTLDADIGRENLEAAIEVEADEPFLDLLFSVVAPDLGVDVGSLSVLVEGSRSDAVNVSLIDTLVERPSELPLVANLDGSINAARWQMLSLQMEELGTEVNWADGTLVAQDVAVSGALVGASFDEQGSPSASMGLYADGIRYDAAEERLGLNRFRISAGSALLRASGELDLAGYEPATWSETSGSIDGRLRVADPARMVALLKAAGLLSEEAPLDFREDAVVRLDFNVEGSDVGLRAELAPTVRGVTFNSIEVASLEMQALVERNAATVTSFEAIVEDQPISLTEPAAFSWAGELFVVEGLRLRVGDARLAGSAEIGPSSLSADASVSQLAVAMVASMLGVSEDQEYGGTLSADISLAGSPSQPLASVEVRSSGLEIDGSAGEVLVVAQQDASGIVLEQLSVELGEIARARGSGTVPVVISSKGVSVTNLQAADVNLVAFVGLGRVLPDLDLEPWSNAVLRTEIDVEGEGGSASLLVTELDTPGQLALAGVDPFRTIRVDVSAESLVGATIPIAGAVSGGDTEIATFTATVPSGFDAARDELAGEVKIDIPIGRVSHLIPGISLLGGSVVGEVSLGAGEEGLEAAGQLSIEDALVKLAAGIPTISAMNGQITFTERSLTIEELYGRMGQEAINVSGSVTLPEGGDLQTSLPDVDISVEGEGVLLARTPDVVARGDLDLSINSQPEAVRVTGRFDASEVLYTKPVQLLSLGSDAETPGSGIELFYVDAEWARSVSLNIRVVADETIVVDNNLYEGQLSADLRILGSAAVPRPEGRVFASDGVVTLPTATLNVEQLRVQFPPDSALNPSIYARAQADAQGYEMLITVDGQFPNVEVDVASSPPLPTDQALVLLATGRRPSQLTFGGDGGALEAAGTVLGRSLISELAGSVSGDGGGFFERLQFDIERDAESDVIGNVEVEYQFADGEPWYLLIERVQAEEYTVQLSWRLWAD